MEPEVKSSEARKNFRYKQRRRNGEKKENQHHRKFFFVLSKEKLEEVAFPPFFLFTIQSEKSTGNHRKRQSCSPMVLFLFKL